MAIASTRASTQDGTSGTQVGTVVNEDATGAIQAFAQVGNKTTYSETSRTGLTGADTPTGGDLTTTGFAGTAGANLIDLGNALTVHLRATCDTASKTLTGRLIYYDGSNAAIGFSESVSFVSDPTLRLGNASGNFVAQHQLRDCGGARKCRFFVDSVSGGTWSVFVRPI